MDIVVADVPETYGMRLNIDWSEKLKGYFSTYYSHLWIPYNGKPNQININREPFIRQTVMDLNDPSEPAIFMNTAIEHSTLKSYFGNLPTYSSPNENLDSFLEIHNYIVVPFSVEIVHMDIMSVQILD